VICWPVSVRSSTGIELAGLVGHWTTASSVERSGVPTLPAPLVPMT
jgi:hypothetical protein